MRRITLLTFTLVTTAALAGVGCQKREATMPAPGAEPGSTTPAPTTPMPTPSDTPTTPGSMGTTPDPAASAASQ